jgi:hypothetical protein
MKTPEGIDKVFWRFEYRNQKVRESLFIRSNIGKEIQRIKENLDVDVVGIGVDPEGGTTELFLSEQEGQQ